MSNLEHPKLMTVKEAARLLSISPQSVYRLISSGRIPAYRLAVGRGAVRINEQDLLEYLASSLQPKQQDVNAETSIRPFKHLRL